MLLETSSISFDNMDEDHEVYTRHSMVHDAIAHERNELIRGRLASVLGGSAESAMDLLSGAQSCAEHGRERGISTSYVARQARQMKSKLQQDPVLQLLWDEAE